MYSQNDYHLGKSSTHLTPYIATIFLTKFPMLYFTSLCLYTMEYYSAIKNETLPFVGWMDLEGIILSEINRQRKTNTIGFQLYVELKKNKATNKIETNS